MRRPRGREGLGLILTKSGRSVVGRKRRSFWGVAFATGLAFALPLAFALALGLALASSVAAALTFAGSFVAAGLVCGCGSVSVRARTLGRFCRGSCAATSNRKESGRCGCGKFVRGGEFFRCGEFV